MRITIRQKQIIGTLAILLLLMLLAVILFDDMIHVDMLSLLLTGETLFRETLYREHPDRILRIPEPECCRLLLHYDRNGPQ